MATDMEVQILERDENALRFMLTGASTAFANSLRRAMIAEVPTMAIDDVIIVENTSVMYDEILAHRLGLIPLKTDLDAYVLPEECDCKSELGCARCRVSFSLEAEAKDETVTIYSGDLKSEGEARPVNDRIPITKLAPTQRIRLEAYAKLGRGLEHAKWQPVSVCTYKYLPKVSLDERRNDECQEGARYCPYGVFGIEGEKVKVKNELKCVLCMECVRHTAKKPPPIKIGWDDTKFIFRLESTGSLPTERIVTEAAKILGTKSSFLSKQIKSLAKQSRIVEGT